MALSDIILPAGKIIVISSTSTLGLTANGKALYFGTTQRVNDLCEVTSAGASIWYTVDDGTTPFMIISGTIFYMIDENDIIASETALP